MIEPSTVANFVPRMRAIEEIAYAVAEVYGIAPAELIAPGRGTKNVTEARLCVYLLARRCTRLSLSEVGNALGRHTSSVLSGVRRAERLVSRDPYFAGVVAELTERFGANVEVVTQ